MIQTQLAYPRAAVVTWVFLRSFRGSFAYFAGRRKQSKLVRAAHRLGPRMRIELDQDGGVVMLDRPGAGRKALGDLGIASSLGQQGKNLQLAIGQPLWIRARRSIGTARESTRASL